MQNLMKRKFLLFLIIFFSFSPFLPRLISGIDNQPFVIFLILLDYLFFVKKIGSKDFLFFSISITLVICSYLWNFIFGINYYDFGAILNFFLVIVYLIYFNSQVKYLIKCFKKNSDFLFLYFILGAILFYIFNGAIERNLFSYRNYVEADLSRGIHPLSPEPTVHAKILIVFAILCIMSNVKYLNQKILTISILLILNGSGMGFIFLISLIPFLFFNNRKKIIFYPTVLLSLLLIYHFLDLEALSTKRVYLLIDKIRDFDLNYIELFDVSLANRFNSFLISFSKFIDNPIFGHFFTFDSIGGYISIIGYLGFAPFLLLIYILYKCIFLPNIIIIPVFAFIGLFVFSDSYVLPCFYILFSFIKNYKKINFDIIRNPTPY